MLRKELIEKFKKMNFEDKKVEIMSFLKELRVHSTRAKTLWETVPKMEETSGNTEELITNYYDIMVAIDEVEDEEEEEKNKHIDIKVKEWEKNKLLVSKKIKEQENNTEEDLDNFLESSLI